MSFRPCRSSVENFSALVCLEEKLGHTWSPYGPHIVLMSRHSVDIGLRPYLLSLENFRALAGLEVRLGQTWYQYGPDMVPNNRGSMDIDLRPC